MLKHANKIIIIVFITFLFGIFSLNLLIPTKNFSESENRRLAQLPEFNWKNVISGRFSRKFETFVKDQFVFKDFWVAIKSDVERLTLKSENNGVFFGKDGYLLEHYKKPDKSLDENIESINTFVKKMPTLSAYLLLAPNSVKIYEDKLPIFTSPYDQLKTIKHAKENLNQDINFIDIYEVLQSKKDQYIYFKTDHHWTMKGAYYAYKKLAKYLSIQPYELSDFSSEIVTNTFFGTYYSKANNRHIYPDYIEIFRPKSNITYEVFYDDGDKGTDKLFELEHLKTKDKYSVFLDGNHALVTIKTNVKNDRKIVIFKDSFAHCFIPFLTNHFEEIHVIDLRYYKLNVYQYIQKHHIQEALFLYSVSNFSSDENIRRLQ